MRPDLERGCLWLAAAYIGMAILAAAIRPAAAAEPRREAPAGAPRSAEAEAQTYSRCMTLAKTRPKEALALVEGWKERGGAHPAEHCAAVAMIGLKQYRPAAERLEALAQAMTKAPAALRAEILGQAGQAWLLAGEPARAYAAANSALELAPDDLDLLVDRAAASAGSGHYEKALEDLDRVLIAAPDRADALLYRASANRQLKRLDAALADIERVLAVTPDSVAALLERGNIRGLRGDLSGARADWVRVGEIEPNGPADQAARANLAQLERSETAPPGNSRPAR